MGPALLLRTDLRVARPLSVPQWVCSIHLTREEGSIHVTRSEEMSSKLYAPRKIVLVRSQPFSQRKFPSKLTFTTPCHLVPSPASALADNLWLSVVVDKNYL